MGNLRGAIILIGIACPVVKTVNKRFKIAVLLGILALSLGLAALGTLSPRTGILANCDQSHGNAFGYWENGAGALGDCLDSGGILFKGRPNDAGPGVEPLGEPIDGGILFSRPPTIKLVA